MLARLRQQYTQKLCQCSNAQIVVWGMGGRYHAMRHIFEGRNILAFATNDTRLHGTQFENRPVIGLKDLGRLGSPVVCVCSFAEHAILLDIRRRYGMSIPVITLWPLEGQSTVPQGIHFVSPEDTQPLHNEQLAHARRICKHIHALVLQREAELSKGILDADIASGNSNWDTTPANDYTYKYARLQKGEAEDISYLRAFAAHFTGHILYGQPEAPWYWQSSFARLTPSYLHELAQKRKEEISLLLPLWEYAVRDIPKKYLFSAPPVLGEIGWLVDGGVVNRDAFAYQERVRILYDANVLAYLERIVAQRGCLRVLEIGGGYGAIAHWMLRLFPQCRYTIVDLPESLLFSHLYLSLTRPDVSAGIGASAPCNLRFVPNWQADELHEPQDIVLNTLSMSEMNEAQVRNYAMLIRDRWLVEGGIFFEQNQDNRSVGMLCAANILAEYFPFRKRIIYDGCTQGNPNIWSVHPLPEGLA